MQRNCSSVNKIWLTQISAIVGHWLRLPSAKLATVPSTPATWKLFYDCVSSALLSDEHDWPVWPGGRGNRRTDGRRRRCRRRRRIQSTTPSSWPAIMHTVIITAIYKPLCASDTRKSPFIKSTVMQSFSFSVHGVSNGTNRMIGTSFISPETNQ